MTVTPAQRLALRLSEQRERLNHLSGLDSLSDDERTEIDSLTRTYSDTEKQWRAATLADEVGAAGDGDGDRTGTGCGVGRAEPPPQQGDPDRVLQAATYGTALPSELAEWWPELIAAGSTGSTHVTALQGTLDGWDSWPVIRRANPLMSTFPDSRATLLEERDAARADSRLRAAFCSYRLNLPTQDESTTLITLPEWGRVYARTVPDRDGRPVVGLDMAEGRAWCAAVAIWRNGRTEAISVAPGEPDIQQQERRDRVPRGTYARLVDAGTLTVAEGLHVPTARQVVERIMPWHPSAIVCGQIPCSESRSGTASGTSLLQRRLQSRRRWPASPGGRCERPRIPPRSTYPDRS